MNSERDRHEPIESNLEDFGELEDLESALGLEEVELDQAVIDSVATDDTNDFDDDGDDIIDDADDEPIIDDRPQAFTESYGTGLQGRPSDRAGRYSRRSSSHVLNQPDHVLTGGDVDANSDDAESVGEEAVGGTVMTPDQSIVDEIAAAVGVEMDDRSFLRMGDMLEQRDDRRWELDPESSEDYREHQD